MSELCSRGAAKYSGGIEATGRLDRVSKDLAWVDDGLVTGRGGERGEGSGQEVVYSVLHGIGRSCASGRYRATRRYFGRRNTWVHLRRLGKT